MQRAGGDGPPGWAEVDGYQMQRLVRGGPAAETYLATHRATRAYRELIVGARAPGVDPAALRRSCEAHAFAAQTVRHPGVCAVEDVGLTHDGRLYVATARPVGRALDEALGSEGGFGERRALRVGLAVVDAVAAAHDAGVVHGRLSPEAVLLIPQQAGTPEDAAVLGFGAAPAFGPGPDERPSFASPERLAGGPPSAADDVFALGSLVHAMLAGTAPPPVRAAARPAGASPEGPDATPTHDLAGVLRRARAADPGRRYRTAGELAAALRQIEPAATAPAVEAAGAPAREASRAARPGRRRDLVAAEVGGFVVTAGAALALWYGVIAPSRAPRRPAVSQAPARALTAEPAPAPTTVVASLAPAVPPAPVPPATATSTGPTDAMAGAGAAPGERRPDTSGTRRDAALAPPVAPAVAVTVERGRGATSSVGGDVVADAHPAEPRPADARTPEPPEPPEPRATEARTSEARAPDARTAEARSAAGVWAAVVEYANAVEARDLARMGRVYPGMTEQQRSAWRTFFGSVADLRTQLVVDQITISGDTALARVRGTYEYQNLKPHRTDRIPVAFKATLAREAGAWRVRAVE